MSDITYKKLDRQSEDYQRYFNRDGSEEFSPERNAFIIENSIKKYNAFRKKKQQMYDEDLAQRSELVYSYIRYADKGGNKSIEDYVGKRELARIEGEQIKRRLLANGKYLPIS